MGHLGDQDWLYMGWTFWKQTKEQDTGSTMEERSATDALNAVRRLDKVMQLT